MKKHNQKNTDTQEKIKTIQLVRTDIFARIESELDLHLDQYVNLTVGYDGRIYLLYSANIPDRWGDRFASFPAIYADSDYCAVVVECDWDTGVILDLKAYVLGHHMMDYNYIRPVKEGFLLVDARCMNYADGPDLNAVIVDRNGQDVREFCLGDGIRSVLTTEDRIYVGYFDEGVFGNFGWGISEENGEPPIGQHGLNVFDLKGNILWHPAGDDIVDCYAMTLDSNGTLYYYYYTDFDLVCTDLTQSRTYKTDLVGSKKMCINKRGDELFFLGGYDDRGSQYAYHFDENGLSDKRRIEFYCGEQKIDAGLFSQIDGHGLAEADGMCIYLYNE